MRLQQEKLKSVEFRKLSIKLTFSKLPQFFGCKDARRGDNVVTDDAIVWVVREPCKEDKNHQTKSFEFSSSVSVVVSLKWSPLFMRTL